MKVGTPMSPIGKRIRFGLAVRLLLVGVLVWPLSGVAQAASPTTFSGQATVLKGTVAGMPVTLVDTGPINTGGGELEGNLLCYPSGTNCTITPPVGDVTNGMVSAEVLHAAVVAHGNKSSAEASIAELNLKNVAGNTISASFITATATATCNGSTASVAGSTEIASLVINGQQFAVTGEVQQTIALPGGGSVIINDQTASASANNGGITVTALHVQIPGLVPGTDTDLVVAQAHADISCGQANCSGTDKVTGGGWVTKLDGSRLNFAVAARQDGGWGHFMFIDHGTGDKFKATLVNALTFDATGAAVVTGVGDFNGASSTPFEVLVKDNGEPGRNTDMFELVLPTKLSQITLSGGNIQFHKPCK